MAEEDVNSKEEEVDDDEEDREDEEIDDEEADKRLAELEAKAARVDELEKELSEKEQELRKYSGKELNFQKLREMKKAEKDEILKKYNEKEKMLIEEVSSIRGRLDDTEKTRMNDAKESFFDVIGADDDLKKKLDDAVQHATAYLGEPKNPSEIKSRYKNAYDLIKQGSGVNPLNRYVPTSVNIDNPSGGKRFTDTAEGKKAFKDIFGMDLDKK